MAEERWLLSQVDLHESLSLLEKVFPNCPKLYSMFEAFLNGNRGFFAKARLLVYLRRCLKVYRCDSFQELKYVLRRLGMIMRYGYQKYTHLPLPYRRVLLSGGKIIAVIGCDGAGKSTVNTNVLNTIRKKADVFLEYFGSGDGHCFWYRYPLLLFQRIRSWRHHDQGDLKSDPHIDDRKRITVAKAIWAVLLAKEKESKLSRINVAKSRGMIVLCDRYPQTQYSGINDGPLLSAWLDSSRVVLRRIAAWEWRIYERAQMIQPDLVIKLMITEEASRERKPEEKAEIIHRKIEIMDHLSIPARESICVDATQSINMVLKNVYRSISKCLSGNECD